MSEGFLLRNFKGLIQTMATPDCANSHATVAGIGARIQVNRDQTVSHGHVRLALGRTEASCLPPPAKHKEAVVQRFAKDPAENCQVWKRREVGIRVPNNSIVWQLVEDTHAAEVFRFCFGCCGFRALHPQPSRIRRQ